MARRALVVSNKKARLELMEMAATFQRLALRETKHRLSCNSNDAFPPNAPIGRHFILRKAAPCLH